MSNLDKFNMESIEETFASIKTGEMKTAKMITKNRDGIVVNIGGKKDGLIPYSELEDPVIKDLKIGDVFEIVIINPKGEDGMVNVSKAKADAIRTGNAIIGGLNIGDVTNFIITANNKAGLISNIGSFEVFIPYSQISSRRVDANLANYINKQVAATILEIDLANNKIIASIRANEEAEQQTKESAFWNSMFENKVVKGTVIRFADFGAFVNVDGVDCLVHNTEASFESNKKASEVLELDKTYNFKVIKLDREAKKVSLSLRALQEDPRIAKIKEVQIGDIVEGKVTRILPFGAIVEFNNGVEGLLHVKEASHYYVKNVYEVAKVDQKLTLKVIDIDMETMKVSLSLKALQEEPDVLKLEGEIKKDTKETKKSKN